MGALLDDAAVVQHHDPVHPGDGREPVRDGDHGLALHHAVERLLDRRLDLESSAEVASSSTRIGASFRITRASAMRWRCPPESFTPRSPTRAS
jgi:hypothetical protein